MIGETVGNYRILKLIGEGGMGVVYLAEHPGIGRKAAVKVLNAGMAKNAEIVTRFFNEARAANAVRHPGIVQVFDFGTLPTGATYIIMEFLEGESLASRLKRSERLPIATAVDLTCQAADVLAATHDQGIVHRDLKPDNLFLVPDQRQRDRDIVKVLDFGIAKLSLSASDSGGVRTQTGALMGTPRYMSPEQCRGTREVDLRTDIYALGVILYQMVCGFPPFSSEGHGELIHMHIAVAPQPPRSYNKAISPALEAVILKALAKEPNARQQTMAELQRALRNLPADGVVATGGSGARTPMPRLSSTMPATPVAVPVQTTFSSAIGSLEEPTQRARRSPWPIVLGLAVLAAGGAGAAVMFTRSETPLPAKPPLPSASATAAPPPPARPAEPTPPVPAPTISVAITSEPAGARVVRARDGADIGVTPFRESWPEGKGTESLRLEHPGYRTEECVVPLDRGVDLRFTLDKAAERAPEKKHAHQPHHPSPAAQPAAPAPPPAKPTPPEPVPL